MIFNFLFIFLLFISYSVIGWILECLSCSLMYKKVVYDRGFLIGPYCPIYGLGGLGSYLLLSRYYHDPITLFILAAVGASVLEYVTSYLMEKMFNARWWDYSNRSFNLEGRICLGNTILFGILGLVFTYLINPFYTKLLKQFPDSVIIIVSSVLLILFLIDIILSFTIMTKLKLKITNIKKDSTTEIDHQVKTFLSHHNFFIKRIFRAFPKIKLGFPAGEGIQKKILEFLPNLEKKKK